MADLIDRGKLIDYIMESDPDWCVKPVRPIFDFINALPSADAVEVVRCRDCKWFGKIGCAIKIVDESDKPHEHDFCSFAERRTDETD